MSGITRRFFLQLLGTLGGGLLAACGTPQSTPNPNAERPSYAEMVLPYPYFYVKPGDNSAKEIGDRPVNLKPNIAILFEGKNSEGTPYSKRDMSGVILEAATSYSQLMHGQQLTYGGRPISMQIEEPIPHPDVNKMSDLELMLAEEDYFKFVGLFLYQLQYLKKDLPKYKEWLYSDRVDGYRATLEIVNDYFRIRKKAEERTLQVSDLSLLRNSTYDAMKEQATQFFRDSSSLTVMLLPGIGPVYMGATAATGNDIIAGRDLNLVQRMLLVGAILLPPLVEAGGKYIMNRAVTASLARQGVTISPNATIDALIQNGKLSANDAARLTRPDVGAFGDQLIVLNPETLARRAGNFSGNVNEVYKAAADAAKKQGGMVILDVGARDAKHFSYAVDNGLKVIKDGKIVSVPIPNNSLYLSLDFNSKYLLNNFGGKTLASATNRNITYVAIQGDALQMPRALTQTVDRAYVIAPWDTIGYGLPSADSPLASELYRILSPQGKLFIAPNAAMFQHIKVLDNIACSETIAGNFASRGFYKGQTISLTLNEMSGWTRWMDIASRQPKYSDLGFMLEMIKP
jgi:hypothetical protein